MKQKGHGVVTFVLAGGEGKRLWPLSRNRAKPAMPVAGHYRLIDFVLTNLVHSHLLRIHVLTQYQSYSLVQHLNKGWSLSSHLGQCCEVIPATSGEGKGWYQGSVDAIYQNFRHVAQNPPQMVAIFGSDHIYRMDIRQMIDEHIDSGADATVAVVPQPLTEAHRFGCVGVDDKMRVNQFVEKSSTPPISPQNSNQVLASMGNYVFNFDVLGEILEADHVDAQSKHDIGGDVLPRWFDKIHIHAYNFLNNDVPGVQESERGYWRDVGTIQSYWQSAMDIVSVSPIFNLYSDNWPILTARSDYPPAKFVFADVERRRIGIATDSLVSNGCIISGGHIDRSILSPHVRINSYSEAEESIFFENVDIGRHCRIRRTIIDKGVRVPPHMRIGYDEEEDRARGIHIAEDGIRVVPQWIKF